MLERAYSSVFTNRWWCLVLALLSLSGMQSFTSAQDGDEGEAMACQKIFITHPSRFSMICFHKGWVSPK
jgi:hypothetical protein